MKTTTEGSQLAEFLLDHVGDDLRSVVTYWGRGKAEFVYARDDLNTSIHTQEGQITELLIESITKAGREQSFENGPLNCTVRYFRDATILHFTLAERVGIAASLEPQTSIVDDAFVEKCRAVMGLKN